MDLIISWKFGEIKAPTNDERDAVNSVDANRKLTWEYLLSLQKKYCKSLNKSMTINII